jgi:hypothetical protein
MCSDCLDLCWLFTLKSITFWYTTFWKQNSPNQTDCDAFDALCMLSAHTSMNFFPHLVYISVYVQQILSEVLHCLIVSKSFTNWLWHMNTPKNDLCLFSAVIVYRLRQEWSCNVPALWLHSSPSRKGAVKCKETLVQHIWTVFNKEGS